MPLPQSARKLRRLLEEKGTVTASGAAGHLRRSQRHVRRLVQKLRAEGVPVEKDRDGRTRTYSIPPDARRTRVPVRLSPRALRRLHELAKEDDHEVSAEAQAALARALRAEP